MKCAKVIRWNGTSTDIENFKRVEERQQEDQE